MIQHEQGPKRREPVGGEFQGVRYVMVPFVRAGLGYVQVEAARWNRSRGAYWVKFFGGRRDWVPDTDVVWQSRLEFD